MLLIQPTSPFRSDKTINKGIELFFNNHKKPIVGVIKYQEKLLSNLYWLRNNKMTSILKDENKTGKTLENKIYKITGSFYLINPKDPKKIPVFYSENSIPLEIVNDFEAIDIDTETDTFSRKNL